MPHPPTTLPACGRWRKRETCTDRAGAERRDAPVEQLARTQSLAILTRHQPDPREAKRDEAQEEGVGRCRRWRRWAVERIEGQDRVADRSEDQRHAEDERDIGPSAPTQPKDQANDTGRQTERGTHPAVGHPQLQSLGPAHDQPHHIGGQQATHDTEHDRDAPTS